MGNTENRERERERERSENKDENNLLIVFSRLWIPEIFVMCEFGKGRERGGFKLQWVEREGEVIPTAVGTSTGRDGACW